MFRNVCSSHIKGEAGERKNCQGSSWDVGKMKCLPRCPWIKQLKFARNVSLKGLLPSPL